MKRYLAAVMVAALVIGLLGMGSAWLHSLGVEAVTSPAPMKTVLTKEQAIDQWFRAQVDDAYGIEVISTTDTPKPVAVVRYHVRDGDGGFATREAVFHFDQAGVLFAVQGDGALHAPSLGVAVR